MKIETTYITSIIKHNKKLIDSKFYEKCIEEIKKIDKNGIIEINNIDNNKYLLESLRLYLIEFFDEYDYLLYNGDYKGEDIIRKIELNRNGTRNFLNQIKAIEYNDIKKLCEPMEYKNTDKERTNMREQENDKNILNIVIENNSNNKKKNENKSLLYKINKIESLNLLLGYNTLQVIEKQDMDRLCSYIFSEKKEVKRTITMIKDFIDYYKRVNENIKKRTIIFSGAILTSLGTTYTEDIDLIYYGENQNENVIEEVKKIYNKKYIDYSIINNKRVIKANGYSRSYLYEWLTKEWPQLLNIESIKEVITNPEHHYYFMGMKLISVELTIERLMKRSSPSSFVDLIMLEKVNNYKSQPCFPNLVLRQGKITIYDDNMINKKLQTVKKYFKHWHNIDYSLTNLKNKIKRCTEDPHNIYKNKVTSQNPYSKNIKLYNKLITKYLVKKFQNNSNKILDIGSGKMQFLVFYKNLGINNIYGIEPSQYSIEGMYKIIEDRNVNMNNIKLNVVEGKGDKSWTNSKYESIVNNKPYKLIIFNFSIHYMLENIQTLINNIDCIDNENTIIIITFIDGDKIAKIFENNDRYEIFIQDEPYYGIYKFNYNANQNLNKIMVYFKGIYGVESGSIEYLTQREYLERHFKKIGYKIILDKNFTEFKDKYKNLYNNFNDSMKQIIDLQRTLVFKKKNNYRTKYIKYMNEYKKLSYN